MTFIMQLCDDLEAQTAVWDTKPIIFKDKPINKRVVRPQALRQVRPDGREERIRRVEFEE